jgi:hypothetical protein
MTEQLFKGRTRNQLDGFETFTLFDHFLRSHADELQDAIDEFHESEEGICEEQISLVVMAATHLLAIFDVMRAARSGDLPVGHMRVNMVPPMEVEK